MTDDLPPWAHVAHPAPPSPRRRYVVDLPDGENAVALIEMARCVLRAEAAKCVPNGARRAALLMLAGGRIEEVPR